MKKIIIFMMLCLFGCQTTPIFATDKLYFKDAGVALGDTREVLVYLQNDEDTYAAFQFNLILPAGLSVTDCSIDPTRVPESTTLAMSSYYDDYYGGMVCRFLAAAYGLEEIQGNDGPIVKLTLSCDENANSGSYSCGFNDVKLSRADGTGRSYWQTMYSHITIWEPAVVTARSYTIQYGEALPYFNYDVEGGYIGGEPELTCNVTANSPAGIYPITISPGEATNYAVTYVPGTLTITKAPLTITAKSYTIKQGDELPDFEVDYAGFAFEETSEVLSKLPVITLPITSSNEPGVYDIIVSGAEADNYEFTYCSGTLAIEEQTISPYVMNAWVPLLLYLYDGCDLSNNVIGDIYFNMNSENGDGYDAAEGAVVLNSTTTEEQMAAIMGAEVGNASLPQNFNGIIFKISEGYGKISVDAKTIGSHVLNVKVGDVESKKTQMSERETVDVFYHVVEPTYVYLYADTKNGSSAPTLRAPVIDENSLLVYGYSIYLNEAIIGDVNGDGMVDVADGVEIVNYILNNPPADFNAAAADVNVDGQITIADAVGVVDIILNK